MKIIKTVRALICLSFRGRVDIDKTAEVPQNVKITCTKSDRKGYLEKIGTEYGLQPEYLKGEIEHSVINKSNFADVKHISEPHLKLDVL